MVECSFAKDRGFEFCCSHLLWVRIHKSPWHSGNYRVWIQSKYGMIQNIQSPRHLCYIFEYVYLHTFYVNFLLKRHLSRGHRISCSTHHLGRTDNKPFNRLIGPIYWDVLHFRTSLNYHYRFETKSHIPHAFFLEALLNFFNKMLRFDIILVKEPTNTSSFPCRTNDWTYHLLFSFSQKPIKKSCTSSFPFRI